MSISWSKIASPEYYSLTNSPYCHPTMTNSEKATLFKPPGPLQFIFNLSEFLSSRSDCLRNRKVNFALRKNQKLMFLFVEEDCPSSLYLRILVKYLHLEKSFGLKVILVDEALKHSGNHSIHLKNLVFGIRPVAASHRPRNNLVI